MDFNNFKPCFLIAMPELQDPNFIRSVVLVTDYQEEGVVGFIINRPSSLTLGKSVRLDQGSINPCYENIHLLAGGPVEPSHIWMIYDVNACHDLDQKFIELDDGLGLAKDMSLLTRHDISLSLKTFRVVHGYTGWGRDQLHTELANSFWITAPLSRKLIFGTPPEKIWGTAIRQLGFEPEKLVGASSPFIN